MMRTLWRAALAAAVAVMLLLNAIPAHGASTVAGGLTISDGKHRCTLSFPDPKWPEIVYTAGHCYHGKRAVKSVGRHVGEYRPDIYNEELDIIAIHLYQGVSSTGLLCGGGRCLRLLEPIPAVTGDYVCKFGSKSKKSCGTITAVWRTRFHVDAYADHGDSGGPVFQETREGAHLVGIVESAPRRAPGTLMATPITAINGFLSQQWGKGWPWSNVQ